MNIKKYYLYQWFKEFMPIYSVFIIMLENRGLTISQISILLTIWSAPVLLLEIPSGILADRWSRKNLLVIGNVLKTLCFVVWICSNQLGYYALGFILWGISCACTSGAEEALIYDSLKYEQKEGRFEHVLSRGRFLSGFSAAIASLVGGFIAMYFGLKLVLVSSIVSGIISICMVCSMKEINYHAKKQNQRRKLQSLLTEEFKFFKNNKGLTILVLMLIFAVGTAAVLDEFDQLIAKDFGLTLGAVGVWITVRNLIASIGSLLAPYIRTFFIKCLRIRKNITIVVLICVLAAILLGASGYIAKLWALIFYAMYFLLMAASEVLVEDSLHQKIEEEGRSTIQSIVSLLLSTFGIFFYVVLGIVFNYTNLFGGIIFIAIYIVGVIVVLSTIHGVLSRNKKIFNC